MSSERCNLACAPIKASDQPAHPRSLIRVFDGHLWVVKGPKIINGIEQPVYLCITICWLVLNGEGLNMHLNPCVRKPWCPAVNEGTFIHCAHPLDYKAKQLTCFFLRGANSACHRDSVWGFCLPKCRARLLKDNLFVSFWEKSQNAIHVEMFKSYWIQAACLGRCLLVERAFNGWLCILLEYQWKRSC